MDAKETLNRLEGDGIEHLWVIYHDYSGRSSAKIVTKESFTSVLERGMVFAQANLDATMEDRPTPGAIYGASSGDFFAVPDPASYAPIPYRQATARMHAFMFNEDGTVWEGCPRTRLQSMVDAYASEGLGIRVGFEPEFYLFKPGQNSEYSPADADGIAALAGLDRHHSLWKSILDNLSKMGVKVSQLGKEGGPGQYEATTHYAEPLKAVDDYLTFKEVSRALAREVGCIASFMPKPYTNLYSCGLHLHLSLWDTAGQRDLSMGQSADELLSPLGRYFVGGLLAHSRALTGVGAPIVNSYKRLLPGSWAPAHICWGLRNRAALVRIPGMGSRRRIEFRSGDNAANPFIFLTAVLASGLDGIKKGIEPPPPVVDDVGQLSDQEAEACGLELLPRSLPAALDAFEADQVLKEALGEVITLEFLRVKRGELDAYNLHVHPWERKLYLEAI